MMESALSKAVDSITQWLCDKFPPQTGYVITKDKISKNGQVICSLQHMMSSYVADKEWWVQNGGNLPQDQGGNNQDGEQGEL